MDPEQKHIVNLQLTRPALEALIGSDPEVHLRLTQQVTEEYAKRHIIKCLNGHPMLTQMIKNLDAFLQLSVSDRIGEVHNLYSGRTPTVTLSSEVENNLQRTIDEKARLLTEQMVKAAVARAEVNIEVLVERHVTDAIRTIFKKKCEAAIGKALAEMEKP